MLTPVLTLVWLCVSTHNQTEAVTRENWCQHYGCVVFLHTTNQFKRRRRKRKSVLGNKELNHSCAIHQPHRKLKWSFPAPVRPLQVLPSECMKTANKRATFITGRDSLSVQRRGSLSGDLPPCLVLHLSLLLFPRWVFSVFHYIRHRGGWWDGFYELDPGPGALSGCRLKGSRDFPMLIKMWLRRRLCWPLWTKYGSG